MSNAPLIMAGAWLMNMLPFIGINRVMFLYHYFTALIWAILMLAYLVDRSRHARRASSISQQPSRCYLLRAVIVRIASLTDSAYNNRV